MAAFYSSENDNFFQISYFDFWVFLNLQELKFERLEMLF